MNHTPIGESEFKIFCREDREDRNRSGAGGDRRGGGGGGGGGRGGVVGGGGGGGGGMRPSKPQGRGRGEGGSNVVITTRYVKERERMFVC